MFGLANGATFAKCAYTYTYIGQKGLTLINWILWVKLKKSRGKNKKN
jgi:hypothetical protein